MLTSPVQRQEMQGEGRGGTAVSLLEYSEPIEIKDEHHTPHTDLHVSPLPTFLLIEGPIHHVQ